MLNVRYQDGAKYFIQTRKRLLIMMRVQMILAPADAGMTADAIHEYTKMESVVITNVFNVARMAIAAARQTVFIAVIMHTVTVYIAVLIIVLGVTLEA